VTDERKLYQALNDIGTVDNNVALIKKRLQWDDGRLADTAWSLQNQGVVAAVFDGDGGDGKLLAIQFRGATQLIAD
jgi:hypothetical protein